MESGTCLCSSYVYSMAVVQMRGKSCNGDTVRASAKQSGFCVTIVFNLLLPSWCLCIIISILAYLFSYHFVFHFKFMEFIRVLKGEQLVPSTHAFLLISLSLSIPLSPCVSHCLCTDTAHKQPSQNDKDGKWFSSLWENIFYLVSLKDIMKVLYNVFLKRMLVWSSSLRAKYKDGRVLEMMVCILHTEMCKTQLTT